MNFIIFMYHYHKHASLNDVVVCLILPWPRDDNKILLVLPRDDNKIKLLYEI